MVAKKTKRYLVVYDAEGEPEVWFQYADGSVKVSTLHPVDISGSDIGILDLRSDREDVGLTEEK